MDENEGGINSKRFLKNLIFGVFGETKKIQNFFSKTFFESVNWNSQKMYRTEMDPHPNSGLLPVVNQQQLWYV